MIGDPVALTVRRNIERPSKTIMKAFAGMPTGFVTDAYNGKGCLDYAIKPLLPNMNFSGSAITAYCGPMDNLAAMAILDFAKKGDVIVISDSCAYSNHCLSRGSCASDERSAASRASCRLRTFASRDAISSYACLNFPRASGITF